MEHELTGHRLKKTLCTDAQQSQTLCLKNYSLAYEKGFDA